MKKGTLITAAVIILALLVAVWVYLLFFGTPRGTDEIFANLGLTGGEDRPVTEEQPLASTTESVGDVPREPLRQLTTRPVSGFVFVSGQILPIIRFAERGTGHVYEIDVLTGSETQVTTLTVPQTVETVFAPDGSSAVHTTYIDRVRSSVISMYAARVGETSITESISLPPGADNISYATASSVLYTVADSAGTTGYRFNISSQVREELFVTPLRQVTMEWGNGLDAIYLYTKPSEELEGYAYRVLNNQFIPVNKPGLGLVMAASNLSSVHSYVTGRQYVTEIVSRDEATSLGALTVLIPEKCAYKSADQNRIWCGAPRSNSVPSNYLTNWYKGTLKSADLLWFVNVDEGRFEVAIDPEAAVKTSLDMTDLKVSEDGLLVSFKNKTDNSLWLFDSILVAI